MCSDTVYEITIVNWDKYQLPHKTVHREWISVATRLLHDPQIFSLTVEQRWVWIALLLHAGCVGPVFKLSASSARVLFKLRPGWKGVACFRSLEIKGLIALDRQTYKTDRQTDTLEQQAAPVERKPDSGYSENFERFWTAYPNKKGKAKAFAAWKRHRLDPHTDALIDNVELRLREDGQWTRDGGKYIPHGSTWLANKRWEDEIDPLKAFQGKNAALRQRLGL